MSANDYARERTSVDRIAAYLLKSLVVALRPRQWTKNVLVFLAPARCDAYYLQMSLPTVLDKTK